jgi:hypothetical protein
MILSKLHIDYAKLARSRWKAIKRYQMSGTDYTKKAAIGNREGESRTKNAHGPVRPGLFLRLAMAWYELTYLYRSRVEKWLLGCILLILACCLAGIVYLGRVYERPAPIELCPNNPKA